MTSNFVASTEMNCETISQIIQNANIFEHNSKRVLPLIESVNSTVQNYSVSSRRAIRGDLIRLGLKSINWKKIQKDLEKKPKNIVPEIKSIRIPKINYPTLSFESFEKMSSSNLDKIESASVYVHYRNHFNSLLVDFPNRVSQFEESYIEIRKNLLPKVKKLLKSLVSEHKRYVYYRKDPGFIKIEGLKYFKSQKRFIESNLKRLVKC